MIQATVTTAPYLVTRRTVNDDYDLIARKTQMDNILLIPGLDRPNPNNLFRDGQVGGWLDPYDLTKMWVDNAGTTPMTASDLGVGVGRIQTKGGPVITFEQATSGDRPVWGRHPVSGIRNLLENSNGFTASPWGVVGAGTGVVPVRTANAAAAPDGTMTATRVDFNRGAGNTAADQSTLVTSGFATLVSGQHTQSIWLKAATSGDVGKQVGLRNVAGAGYLVVTLTADWVRFTRTETGSLANFEVVSRGGFTVDNQVSALLWQGQLEAGATATANQRVTNRFDITETGQPDLYYFSCNGVNQSWSSNATVDFSTTDKVTIWAGLRKLSDAADGTVCELTSGSLDGQIAIDAPGSATAAKYQGVSRGTVAAVPFTTNAAFNAPHTATLVLEGDIAAPLARLSINGTVVSTITTSQGSGNYANANLHIGRRAGSSRPYNGYIYSLIIAGDNYDTRTIQQFSDWSLKPRRLITA